MGVKGLRAQCVTKSQLVLAWDLIGEKSDISFSDKSHKELNEFKSTILEFPRHPIWNCCEKINKLPGIEIRHYLIKLMIERLPLDQDIFFLSIWKVEDGERRKTTQVPDDWLTK